MFTSSQFHGLLLHLAQVAHICPLCTVRTKGGPDLESALWLDNYLVVCECNSVGTERTLVEADLLAVPQTHLEASDSLFSLDLSLLIWK